MDEIKEKKVKKCVTCVIQLLDEKLPFCLRCRLKGRNTAGYIVEVAGGIATAIDSVAAMAKIMMIC